MKGKLAREINLLPNLNSLIISDSAIVDIIFTGIIYTHSLRSLDVSETGLSDVTDLEDAPDLTELNLVNNAISGAVTSQVFGLNTLEPLRLDYNKLSDELYSYNIMELKDLKIFTAEENQITGAMPEGLSYCQLLHALWLGGNQLTGQLPIFLPA